MGIDFCSFLKKVTCLGKIYGTGDQIGVLLDYETSLLTFFKENKEVETVKLEEHHLTQNFYPCVGIQSKGAVVRLVTQNAGKFCCSFFLL